MSWINYVPRCRTQMSYTDVVHSFCMQRSRADGVHRLRTQMLCTYYTCRCRFGMSYPDVVYAYLVQQLLIMSTLTIHRCHLLCCVCILTSYIIQMIHKQHILESVFSWHLQMSLNMPFNVTYILCVCVCLCVCARARARACMCLH